jgi:glycosyltransferase involved in cell wall biosynthesis
MKKYDIAETLYISMDGIMEPLGYSQVFKYLEKLSEHHKINLVTLEKNNDLQKTDALKLLLQKCSKNNITWYRCKYRNGWFGLGQLINVFNLIFLPIYIFLTKKILLIHIRSYMPGIAIPLLSSFFKFKLIFDIRGFWADEKHDRLNWRKDSYKYRFFKGLERYLMRKADFIVTLTAASQQIISNNFAKPESMIQVIPTCVDCNEFVRIEGEESSAVIKIGYLGSVDTAYDFDKFCFLLSQIIDKYEKNLEFRVFSNQKKEVIEAILSTQNINVSKLEVGFVDRANLSKELSKLDFLGFCLKENFSIQASMPTKIAEALACGIPIICNAFNSDIKRLIESNRIGLIYSFEEPFNETYLKSLSEIILDHGTADRCINIAKSYFSLEKGSTMYHAMYSELEA